MATRCKTIEFAFQTVQDTLAAGAERTLSTPIVLTESWKVFRSVTLEIGCTDELAAESSATSITVGFMLAGAGAATTTVSDLPSNTGESSVYHVSRDLTDYFNAHWTTSARSGQASITVGGNATNNHWAKIRITYDYDDASERHVKTIWYPIESTRSLLSTSYQTIGGETAIPALKGGASILPEHDVEVLQVWIELIGNQATADTTDFSLDVKLAGDATEQNTLYRVEAGLATPGWLHAIWDITSSDLSEAQALEAKLTDTSDRVAQLCGWVGITYVFTPVGTTLVWNSLMMAAFDREDQHGSTTSARKSLHIKDVWIEEPGTISIRPSQVFASYDDNALGSSVSLWVGEQTPRVFSTAATGAPMLIAQRMDAGGTSGTGLSLVRGRNRIKIHQFGDVANAGAVSAVNGFMIINYTSGVSPAGIGAHNQTRHFALGSFDADSTNLEYTVGGTDSRTPAIPEERYFLNAVALRTAWLSSGASQQAFRVQVQRTGNEGVSGDGVGWANAYHGAIASAPENWLRWTTADCTELFRRWANDPDFARMDVEADRRWMVLDASGVWVGVIGLLVTYHAVAMTVRGTVSGAAGDGSGLRVNVSRDATGEKLFEVTTTEGGVYEAPWYDDTEALVSDAYQEDDGHVGRSAPFYAAGLYEPPSPPEPDPRPHRETHEFGSYDAIDVTGLSGVLADPQPAIAHAASHLAGGTDPIASATTAVAGLVQLATSVQTTAGLAVQASDSRLSDARTPSSHASSHKSGGSDPIKLDELAIPDDNTTLNATSSRHGLLPKLPTDVPAEKVLTGEGTWVEHLPLDVQVFEDTGSFTWVKPTTFTPRMVKVICIGAGGGGGGGGDNTSSNARVGGCGGGGGAYSTETFPASLFDSTVAGVVGVGGAGGNGGAVNGADGDAGGASYFGTATHYVYAGGGGGGRQGRGSDDKGQGGGGGGRRATGSTGGSTTLTVNEGGPGLSVLDSSTLAASGGTGCRGGFDSSMATSAEYGGGGGGGRGASNTHPGGSSLYGGGGGGAGGGYHPTAGALAPRAGGASGSATSGGGGAAGASGSSPSAGSTGASGDGVRWSGSGGGGGGAHTSTGDGAEGGSGGSPGGGGGGGGAGANATGGKGGAGARGEVRVYTW